MITVKAFDENLCCRGFQYEVGREYEILTDEVRMCERGFHASAHCDISETLNYYFNISKTRYCLVDINVVGRDNDKVVGDKIKIIKELDFDECIKYDKTGEWCYYFAKNVKGANIKKLQDAVIQKDQTGKWCYYFTKDIKGVNVKKPQKAVIKKNQFGKWYCYFVENIKKEKDIQKFKNISIKKESIWSEIL